MVYEEGGNSRDARWRQEAVETQQPWRKFCGNLGGGNGARGTHSRFRGGAAGTDKRVFRDDEMETGDT